MYVAGLCAVRFDSPLLMILRCKHNAVRYVERCNVGVGGREKILPRACASHAMPSALARAGVQTALACFALGGRRPEVSSWCQDETHVTFWASLESGSFVDRVAHWSVALLMAQMMAAPLEGRLALLRAPDGCCSLRHPASKCKYHQTLPSLGICT